MTIAVLTYDQSYLIAAPNSPTSTLVGRVGIGVMLLGGLFGMFPLWKSARLSPDSIQRRSYWTGCIIAAVLFFVSTLPDWEEGLLVSIAMAVAMFTVALMWTKHVKINGRIISGSREPDRPPALRDGPDDSG